MNIYDISKVAGVSIASVSRVINGAENVSEKTRRKVLDVIDQYGYTPNAYARGLGRGSMKTIGLMCSDPTDIYLASAINYLETELRSQGYNSILCCTGDRLDNKKASFELLKSRQVDAFILVGSQFVEPKPEDNAYILEGAHDHPVMILNGYLPGDNIYCTLCNEKGGMKDALQHLYDTGARQFMYVYSSVSFSGTQKLAGIRESIRELGLPDEALRTVQGHRRYDEIATLLKEAYDEAPFDAIIASSDTSGVGAVKFALHAGLRLPEDLQIVSWNNSTLAVASSPELTSVDAMLKELCLKTCENLLSLLNPVEDEEGHLLTADIPAKTVMQTHMVKRETTRF
ncbi:MAG TPA: LacI family transcriptional regulator [Oribacterium sp.]|nr:LacI family transcriptional regulator [Oribacterium sp.]HCS67233.1 LacI family transcriptional regulator [Oribacterium sp.]